MRAYSRPSAGGEQMSHRPLFYTSYWMRNLLFAAGVWSPAGGWYADPKHWRRNTALAFVCALSSNYPASVWIGTPTCFRTEQLHPEAFYHWLTEPFRATHLCQEMWPSCRCVTLGSPPEASGFWCRAIGLIAVPVFWKSVELEVGLWSFTLLHSQPKLATQLLHCYSLSRGQLHYRYFCPQAPQKFQEDTRDFECYRACFCSNVRCRRHGGFRHTCGTQRSGNPRHMTGARLDRQPGRCHGK